MKLEVDRRLPTSQKSRSFDRLFETDPSEPTFLTDTSGSKTEPPLFSRHSRVGVGRNSASAPTTAHDPDVTIRKVVPSKFSVSAPSCDSACGLKERMPLIQTPLYVYRCNTIPVRKNWPQWAHLTRLNPIATIGNPTEGSNKGQLFEIDLELSLTKIS